MSDSSNPADEPKIIVDDDWKSQVEKEKEALKEKEATARPSESGDPAPGAEGAGAQQEMELPEASFLVLLSTLGSQAMACMGLLPDPMTGEANVNLPLAKHFVDMLAMLQEKTKGNLSEEEAAHLRDALHQLRMIYVSSSGAPAPANTTPANSGDDSKPASTIELP